LEHEAGPTDKRHVDWHATFPEGSVSVEATVPVLAAETAATVRQRARLHEVIERLVPDGWTALPTHLPTIPERASLQPFRDALVGLFAGLPDPAAAPGTVVEIATKFGRDRIEITMHARTPKHSRIGGGAGRSWYSDASQAILQVWNDDRKRE